MTHTPGPWRIEEGTTLIWGNCDPDDRSSYGMGYPIMDAQYPRPWRRSNPTNDEIEANCSLVAAAPDLLVALKEARDFIHIERDQRLRCSDGISASEADARLQQMDAAIAKAEGCSDAPAHD